MAGIRLHLHARMQRTLPNRSRYLLLHHTLGELATVECDPDIDHDPDPTGASMAVSRSCLGYSVGMDRINDGGWPLSRVRHLYTNVHAGVH